MYQFGTQSKSNLSECDEKLQRVGYALIKIIDVSCVGGYRGEEAQNRAYETKLSFKKFPDGKHNKRPSQAFHLIPYPKGWNAKREDFVYMAGIVIGVASILGISIRWGGDWDSDNDLNDQTFMDLAHFELI